MNTFRCCGALFTCLLIAAGAGTTQAATIDIYTEDLTAFNDTGRNDTGNGVDAYGVITINSPAAPPQPASPFGSGNAIRVVDFADNEKPEIHGELAAPLFEPFRIDFDSFNNTESATTQAIRFRMGNAGINVTSEKRAAFSVSWQADGDIGAKYSGLADGNGGDVDTRNSQPLQGIQEVTMVANGSLTDPYTYNVFGETRTLDPLHYDLYIGGDLLNDSSPGDTHHDDWKNGMQFHFDKSDNEYDTSLGLQQFALFSGSTSGVGPDILFDNIILTTGSDIGSTVIPEPGSIALLAGCALSLATARRSRRA